MSDVLHHSAQEAVSLFQTRSSVQACAGNRGFGVEECVGVYAVLFRTKRVLNEQPREGSRGTREQGALGAENLQNRRGHTSHKL